MRGVIFFLVLELEYVLRRGLVSYGGRIGYTA